MNWTHGYGCDRDGERMEVGEECPNCCRHGWVSSVQPDPCDLCNERVQIGDVLLLVGDHFYTHTVLDPAMWQAPEMDSTCRMWSRGTRVIWTRFHRG